MEFILSAIGLKGILIALVVIWLAFALIKRLVKIAVLAVIVLVAVYYLYPMVSSVFKLQ